MYDYEEVCPVSKAASVLCERWTLQIIREMFFGVSRFNEFRQYLPRMSPTLLNTRLRTLEQQGIIIRRKVPEKRSYEYQLTPAGQALKPLLAEFGKWGMSWVFDRMNEKQLNASTLVRDFAAALQVDKLPAGDATFQFAITMDGQVVRKYILLRDGKAQVCDDNIGYDVDVYLAADIATLAAIWFGERSIATFRKQGLLKVMGTTYYVNTISKWLGTSQFATYNRHSDRATAATL